MDWMDLLLDSVRDGLKASSPRDLANLIGALAMARYQPEEEWAEEALQAIEIYLGGEGAGFTEKVGPGEQ